MRNILLLIGFLIIPILASAKYYKSTVIYRSGETSEVLVKFPLSTTGKNLIIKKSEKDHSERIDRNKILFIKLQLNDASNTYYFITGQIGYFRKNEEFQRLGLAKRQSFSLLKKAYDEILVSEAGIKYAIKGRKGKEKVVIIFEQGMYGLYLSKPNDSILVSINTPGFKTRTMLKRAQKYLFPNCSSLENDLKNVRFKNDKDLYELLEKNLNCN